MCLSSYTVPVMEHVTLFRKHQTRKWCLDFYPHLQRILSDIDRFFASLLCLQYRLLIINVTQKPIFFRVPSKTKRSYPLKFMVCIAVYLMQDSWYTPGYIPIYHTSTFLFRVRNFYFVIHEWSHLYWEPSDGFYVPPLVFNVNIMSLTK